MIKREISSAGFEDREQGNQHLRSRLAAESDEIIGTDAKRT